MCSLKINALGVGAVKEDAPTLCMGFLCYLGGVSSTRTQLSPHGPNMPSSLPPSW